MTEWWEMTLVIMGAIITIFTIWEKVESRANKIKEPTSAIETRVSLIEQKMDDYEIRFKKDKERLDDIEEINKLTLRATLALLNHSLTGNNEDEMNGVKKDLEKFLINK